MVTLTISFQPDYSIEDAIKDILVKDNTPLKEGTTSMGEKFITITYGNKKEARSAKKKVINHIEDIESSISFDIYEESDEGENYDDV